MRSIDTPGRPRAAALLATAAALAVGVGLAPRGEASPPPPVALRIATQAPEGTVWSQALLDIKSAVERGSRNQIQFQYFFGTQGDEKVIIERMQSGLLHGGLFTGIGLGEVLPEARILELPFMYDSYEEVSAVRRALEEDLKARFDQKGYVFLGWAEVGWAYVFSKNRARNLEELRQRNIWRWQGDPLAEKVFETYQLAGTPLALTDVLTSLETGMIDSVYNSPYGLVSLQWHRNVRFMSRMTVGHGTGALLVSKAQWEKIPANLRAPLTTVCRRRLDTLLDEVRQKNEEAEKELEAGGVRVIPIPTEEIDTYKRLGAQVADQMVGVLYDQALLDRVRAVLAEVRGR